MTIYQEFKNSVESYLDKIALASKLDNAWQKINYCDLLNQVEKLAAGLYGLGVKKETKVAIMSENRPEWLISDLAINKLGAVSVPIHAIANQDFLKFVLEHSESEFLIVSENLFKKHKHIIKEFNLKIILISKNKDLKEGAIIFFDDLISSKEAFIEPAYEIKEGDLASIIYTSGTTGDPKGVMLTNKNFLANIRTTKKAIKITEDDIFLSFLPLSHVLERTLGSYLPMLSGASIYYAENIKKLADNLSEVKPTILISVPKIFERIYEKIWAGINSKNKYLKNFFFWSLQNKNSFWTKVLADKLIYKKIRASFGGRLKFAASGGASINPRILKFFSNIGITIIEGYGLTETSPIISFNRLGDIRISTVGQPLAGVEVKIADDKEILAKGENVMKAYFKNDKETKEAFTEDGWFRTGDLGFLDSDNFLTIIGRKKDIIVTTNGKNITPAKLEGVLNLSPYIDQAMAVGHKRDYLAALITLDQEYMKNNPDDDFKKIIQKELDEMNKKFNPQERIRNFYLLDKPFTIEAGELTPTLKLRRGIIEAKYNKIIDSLFD